MIRRPLLDVLLAGALALALLAGYVFWSGMVKESAETTAELTGKLAAYGEAGGRAALARKALEELELEEAEVYRHLVAADDVVPFLEKLETTGESLGSSVEVVSVTNVPGKPLESLSLSVRISGSFDAVMRTLGAIEYQEYDTTLVNLTLDTPPGGAAWTAAVTFAVGMRPEDTN